MRIQAQTQTTEDDIKQPFPAGSLKARFYEAVHGTPALQRDVVQVGFADKNLRKEHGFSVSDGKTAYEIILFHAGNVDEATVKQMMALQDKVAKRPQPHPENFIDYKSVDEVNEHYQSGGLGLGIYTADGALIGQTMLTFKLPVEGPLEQIADPSEMRAHVGWLMVDREYGGNTLCPSLLELAIMMAESSGMSMMSANVRIHNKKGLEKFGQHGFSAHEQGQNAKDGSTNYAMYKELPRPQGAPNLIVVPSKRTLG